jgi:hypothetical protein
VDGTTPGRYPSDITRRSVGGTVRVTTAPGRTSASIFKERRGVNVDAASLDVRPRSVICPNEYRASGPTTTPLRRHRIGSVPPTA